jgi:hypothetical protein
MGMWQGQPRSCHGGGTWRHRTPSRGEGGPGLRGRTERSGPRRSGPHTWRPRTPLGSPGPRGPPESIPVLMGTCRPRTYKSTGAVRRPRSQLSGPGCMPRHPKDEEEVTDNLVSIRLDTLVGGTPVRMYRQVLLAFFFIFFTNFPFMHAMHCSKSENSNGGRISLLTNLSIPPSKYGLNDSAICGRTNLNYTGSST